LLEAFPLSVVFDTTFTNTSSPQPATQNGNFQFPQDASLFLAGAHSDFSPLIEPIMRTIQIEQVDGWRKAISEKAVYITKDQQGQLRVLTSVCPHLGCTVPWNKEKKVPLLMPWRHVYPRRLSYQQTLAARHGYA